MLSDLDIAVGARSGKIGRVDGPKQEIAADKVAALLESRGAVVFQNLMVQGTLDLARARVKSSAEFVACEFGDVDASYIDCDGTLAFAKCRFKNWTGIGGVYAQELQFTDETRFNSCQLVSSRFGRAFAAIGIVAQEMILSSVRCDRDLILQDSRIKSLYIDGASAENGISLNGSMIQTLNAVAARSEVIYAEGLVCGRAVFDRAHVDGEISLVNARISSSLSCANANVGSTLNCSGAVLKRIDIQRMSCALLKMHRITVYDDLAVRFSAAGIIEITGKIFGNCRISDNDFSGAATFRGLFVGMQLTFDRNRVAAFLRLDRGDISSYVRGHCTFSGSRVGGQIRVEFARIGGDLKLIAARAVDIFIRRTVVDGALDLSNARAEQSISLRRSLIRGKTDVNSVEVGRTLNLSGAEFDNRLTIESARIGSLDARRASCAAVLIRATEIHGSLELSGATVGNSLEIIDSRLGLLALGRGLSESATFKFPPIVAFRDTSYSALDGGWRDLLTSMLLQSTFDATGPAALERRLRSVGRADWADNAYFLTRKRARTELPRRGQFGQWLLEHTSGYGAIPFRLLRAALVVFVLVLLTQTIAAVLQATAGKQQFSEFTLLGIPDILIRGEKASQFGEGTFQTYSAAIRMMLFVSLALRYLFLAFIGI